ncbi:MAG: CinA family nicotinamide mononucleotide deamidase-related protein [Thermodesulfobacteriota bacterium]
MEHQIWAEVVTIGSELVLGQLVDTNAAYIASALGEIGLGLAFHTTVGDDPERMDEAFRLALERCQVVIATGGLGPTEDDLTRESAARVLGRELIFHPELLAYIEGIFNKLGYRMPSNNRRQAYIPAGAEIIPNPYGTAPCFRAELRGRDLFCLPGVPRETEPLLREVVIPYLKRKYSARGQVLINRVLKVGGLGESSVDAQIKDLIRSSRNPIIGLQASPGEIKVRLTARAGNEEEAGRLLDDLEAKLRERLGPLIFGRDDETLAGLTAGWLKQKGLTVAVAEALTRGLVTAELGRHLESDRLRGGLILNRPVPPGELCRRLFDEFDADLALAVSGLPEPEEKTRIVILARTRDGRESERSLTIGGPERIVLERSATLGLLTLFTLLRDNPG